MIKFLRTLQYYLKIALVGVWCTLVTITFYVLTFPFNHQKWLSWAFAGSLNVGVRFIMGIKVVVLGRENMIDGPAIIIMNHQSNFDPLLQGPVFPKNTVIIGKKEIVKIPLWGRIFRATNNILVDRNSKVKKRSAIDLSVDRLNNDDCYIWIFPEGTRSQGRKMKRFKQGAFRIAIQAQKPIIPMVTKPLQYVLDVPNKVANGGVQEMKILEAISTEGLTEADLPDLIAKCEDIYKRELSHYMNNSPDDIFETTH